MAKSMASLKPGLSGASPPIKEVHRLKNLHAQVGSDIGNLSAFFARISAVEARFFPKLPT